MLWALLDAAIELVPDEHATSYPERTWLQLRNLHVSLSKIWAGILNNHKTTYVLRVKL